MADNSSDAVNITRLIDEEPIRAVQIVAILLCSLAAFMDGADSQAIAIAAPIIAKELNIARSALGPLFSAGLLGAAIGAALFGPLGDRFGRKRMLVVATFIFGIFTLATASANSVTSLLVVRFLAGIGLGGAAPCFITLAAELAPKRHRAMVTSLIWAAFPLGGAVGGFVNGHLLAAYDWKTVFLVGGILPIAISLILATYLPESLRYMLACDADESAIRRVVKRLRPAVPDTARIISDEVALSGAPLRQLFSGGRSAGTLLLWVPFFMAFGTLALAVTWSPLLLIDNGVEPRQVGFIIGIHSMGALIGMSIAGRLTERFGMVYTLVPALVLGGGATAWVGQAAISVDTAAVALFMVGLFVGGGASGAIAVAATIYPTAIRSSGIGWAMSMGRTGQVLAPLFAGAVIASGWSNMSLFMMLGVAPLQIGRAHV